AADQDVIRRTTLEHVGPVAADQQIPAAAAEEGVGAVAAHEDHRRGHRTGRLDGVVAPVAEGDDVAGGPGVGPLVHAVDGDADVAQAVLAQGDRIVGRGAHEDRPGRRGSAGSDWRAAAVTATDCVTTALATPEGSVAYIRTV